MLIAENHGKIVPEAETSEDYLTSAVFGHLRYIPPGEFWPQLIEACRPAMIDQAPLASAIDPPLASYSQLCIEFWRYDPVHGEPDLILHFSGDDVPDLTLMIEVKLFSGKSNTGERDQLAAYLKMLDSLPVKGVPAGMQGQRFLIYLTPRDATIEINETLLRVANRIDDAKRLYHVQWQDLLDVAREVARSAEPPARMILSDVARFLERRRLEYFKGFKRIQLVPFEAADGRFYSSSSAERICRSPAERIPFAGMRQLDWLEEFPIQQMRVHRWAIPMEKK